MMWPTSDRFDAAMAGGHLPVVVRADLYTAGLTQLLAADLPVTGGQVTADRSAAIRRQCDLRVTDPDGRIRDIVMGTAGTDPGATELVVQRGLRFPDSSVELVPLGVFGVSVRATSDSGAGVPLALTGYDRSRMVSRAKLQTTYYIQPGTKYLDAAAALVDNRLPFATPVDRAIESVQPTTTPTVIIYAEADDPWARVGELVGAVGCEAYFEVDGSLRFRDIPDPTLDPVAFEFLDGATSLLLSVDHQLDDEPGFNAVIVTGETSGNTTAVPRAIAYDADPASPTYFFGPYGQVPEFWNEPLATSSSQCATVAAARLRQKIGYTETFTLAAVPHPALTPSDVIRIRRAPSRVDLLAVVESLTVPLDVATAMSVVARVRRTA